jgi:hypothetical protein
MNKKQKRRNMAQSFGKTIINLGQLVFGGIVLGTVLRGKLSHLYLIVGGTVATAIMIFVGTWFSTSDKEG